MKNIFNFFEVKKFRSHAVSLVALMLITLVLAVCDNTDHPARGDDNGTEGLWLYRHGEEYIVKGFQFVEGGARHNVVIPQTHNGYPVVAIEDGAFNVNVSKGITGTVSIPASIRTIGVTAFSGSDITEVIFAPNSELAVIGNSAFASTVSLGTVEIPASVRTIGATAFSGSGITEVIFAPNSDLAAIGNNAFELTSSLGAMKIPASVRTFGVEVFSGSGITEVIFAPNSELAVIGRGAFELTSNLGAMKIPATVRTIGANAFSGSGIATVTFVNSDVPLVIGALAFANTKNMTTLTIPARVTTVANYAFTGWDPLGSIYIPFESLTEADREWQLVGAPLTQWRRENTWPIIPFPLLPVGIFRLLPPANE